jgi:hypothetical protein
MHMQYAVLLYEDERIRERRTPQDYVDLMAMHQSFTQRVVDLGGAVIDVQKLEATGAATSMRWAGEEITISDGPYAETAEQLGGLYLVDLPDLDAAIEVAKLLPHHVEVRPTVPHEGGGDGGAHVPEVDGTVYAVLLYGDEEPWANATPKERDEMYARHGAFAASVFERGAAVVGGAELAHSSTATTVRLNDGGFLVTDGPFAETAEQLTGLYAIKAPSLQLVHELVRGLPGEVTEIRPVASMAAQTA